MTSENAAPAEMPGEEQVRDIIQTVVNQCTSEPTEWSDCVDDATAAILAALAKEREKAFIAGWMSANPDTSDNPGHGEWLLQAATRDWAEWAQGGERKAGRLHWRMHGHHHERQGQLLARQSRPTAGYAQCRTQGSRNRRSRTRCGEGADRIRSSGASRCAMGALREAGCGPRRIGSEQRNLRQRRA